MARKPFLSARWSHLGLFTFALPDEVLAPYLPAGCEFDRHEGHACASLVAFDFLETRVFGWRWPGYTNFPELNLRLYVRHGDKRGVCFVREYVPKRLVAVVARWLYNEPYRAAPMTSRVAVSAESVDVQHEIRHAGRVHRLHWISEPEATQPAADTVEHFFKEHEWGFVRGRDGTTRLYHVRHPIWQVHPLRSYDLSLDWEQLYGKAFAGMQGAQPLHVVHAVGSPVEVWPAGRA